MNIHNSDTSWGWPAKTLHWLMALLILGLLGLGAYMVRLEEGMDRFDLTQIHKSFGFVVFVLACLRIVWRWSSRTTPALPETIRPWERVASHLSHFALYFLMALMPISGWLMASASPFNDPDAYIYIKNMVFGLFELPDPIHPGDKSLEALFGTIHEYAGYTLAGVLVIHIGAALKHHFIERDNVLTRMLPFGK